MRLALRPRWSSFRLLAVLAVFAGLVSSCQSSRSSFAFQPGPSQVVSMAPAIPTVLAATSATPVATFAAPSAARPTSQPLQKLRKQFRRHAVTLMPTAPELTAAPTTAIQRPVVAHRRLFARPHATAESGLGTTVLGVLGLVALPIALIGLAISGGGLVWAIVAGAAALAVLVAYIDPFGR